MYNLSNKVIQVSDLFVKLKKQDILNDISLDVCEGEVFGLLGPSGAGKTTLLKVLTGQIKPTEGIAKIFGTNSNELNSNVYKKIGFVLDDCGLFHRLSCYSNLKIMAMIYDIDEKNIEETLEKVGLIEAKNKAVSKLSKGMIQRLSFSRSILHNPKLLFLDEPTSALDPTTTKKIHDIILDLKSKGTTIILATHDMKEASLLCDNVALINDGRLIEYGAPAKLCDKYSVDKEIKVILNDLKEISLSWKDSDIEKLIFELKNKNVLSLYSKEVNLEDIFIKLTGKELNV